MLTQEIIRRKRDGKRLERTELAFMANGIADGSIGEGQAAAFAMAVFFRGMDLDETAGWTNAMLNSGRIMRWQRERFSGPLLDKHSTGGIGDKVSLILAPMLAACGAYVPMISAYGLGHTGGTLDKLEAIPGFRTQLDTTQLEQVVQKTGCAIVGATESVAPADRYLYSIRDVTATVDSVPLITASILCKKMAAALDGLVLDVKTGSGAFASDTETALELARSLVAVGNQSGLRTVALITDMNQVLGRCAGNSVEVAEAIAFLGNENTDPRLQQIIYALGREALLLGALAKNREQAESMLDHSIRNGAAAERFQAMVTAQGGPSDLVERPQVHLPRAPVIRPVFAKTSGIVQDIDVRAVGMVIVGLGGGRRVPGGAVDPRVGVTEILGIGEAVSAERGLALVHADNDDDADKAAQGLRAAIHISNNNCDSPPLLVNRIG